MNNCSIAIQILPLDMSSTKDIVHIVDTVIEFLQSLPLKVTVAPFETVIEGRYEACMDALRECQIIAEQAGAKDIFTNVKIHYVAEGVELMSTEEKLAKHARTGHGGDASAPSDDRE